MCSLSINTLEVVKDKNERQPFGYLRLCSQDDSVLDLFYKYLVQLYNLKKGSLTAPIKTVAHQTMTYFTIIIK